MRAPVVNHANLLGHGQRDQVTQADESEDRGEKRERAARVLETASIGHAHALSEEKDDGLLIDGFRVGEEEEGEGQVEERNRGNDSVGCDEAHCER